MQIYSESEVDIFVVVYQTARTEYKHRKRYSVSASRTEHQRRHTRCVCVRVFPGIA